MELSESNPLNDSFIEAPIVAISHPLNRIEGVERLVTRTNIKILTYNIFLRPPGIKNNLSDHKDDRLKEFIKVLGDFDIVCLQEMFGLLNKRKHKLIRCATKAGFLYYADSPSPSFFTSFVVDGGLLVLSRFPILASEFKPYPYGIFSDSLAQKGVLYVKIQVQDEALHLYVTHTQASYFGENQRYPILTRADQFNTFRQFINATLKRNGYRNGELTLLMGDFNVDSRKPFIETSKIPSYQGFKLYPHLKAHDFFNEYEAMVCFLSNNFKDGIEDLILKNYGEHPVTYADSYSDDSNEMKPLEVVLTHKDDLCSNQSLDYIFKLSPKTIFRSRAGDLEEGELMPAEAKLRVIDGSAKVEKFFVNDKGFTQMSDHYGCSVTLEYNAVVKRGGHFLSVNSRRGSSHDQDYSQHSAYDRLIDVESP